MTKRGDPETLRFLFIKAKHVHVTLYEPTLPGSCEKSARFVGNTKNNSTNGIHNVLSIQTPSFSRFSTQRLIPENFFRGLGQKHSHTLNTSFKGSERIQNSGARISTAHCNKALK